MLVCVKNILLHSCQIPRTPTKGRLCFPIPTSHDRITIVKNIAYSLTFFPAVYFDSRQLTNLVPWAACSGSPGRPCCPPCTRSCLCPLPPLAQWSMNPHLWGYTWGPWDWSNCHLWSRRSSVQGFLLPRRAWWPGRQRLPRIGELQIWSLEGL